MARGHGRILTSIWEDTDFLKLDEREQRFYLFLISQPNLNHAGLLPLTLRRWSRKAHGLTSADVEKRLQSLDDARFIVMDDDTEELLIRSFVRNDGVWKQPKVMGAMVSGAMEISSRRLRRALLDEVERIPLNELSDEPGARGTSIRQQVAEHIETLRKAFGNPDPTPSGRGSATPSATPSGTPSDTPDEGGPKASTRAHAPASRAHSPAPAPTPVPSHTPKGSAEEDAQGELVVVTDADFVGAAEAAALDTTEAVSSQTIVGEWLERVNKRPPQSVIGQTAKQIKKLLDEGIAPDDIRGGLARWMRKGSAPSAIPSFVNEAMNAAPSNVVQLGSGQPLVGTDAKVAGWMAIAEQLRQEGDSA
ncbi:MULTISPECIES: hypothetical protein [Streptomyces]|uniref:Uncharacterized protein n=2 Tax=Streptomyces TaxID=1883 RepID=A0A2U9P064_STRAS|nr:hypothetical protein [Streptomyces actuosus]AWT42601.1 hypothetical protein DMT42_09930 [Streptomyces actuosus]MBM4819815.1 hypothetical protein [Streptomyces actuosus]